MIRKTLSVLAIVLLCSSAVQARQIRLKPTSDDAASDPAVQQALSSPQVVKGDMTIQGKLTIGDPQTSGTVIESGAITIFNKGKPTCKVVTDPQTGRTTITVGDDNFRTVVAQDGMRVFNRKCLFSSAFSIRMPARFRNSISSPSPNEAR